MSTVRLVTFAALLILAVSPAEARAQDAAQAPTPSRQGFVIGFSVGVGTAPCDPCQQTPGAAGVLIGGMLTERLALLYDGGLVSYTDTTGAYSHVVGGPAVQYFVNEALWIKAGVGVAELMVNDAEGKTRLGLFGALGVEVVQRNRFAMDLSLRVSAGRHPGGNIRHTSAQLGFTWY